MIITTQPPQLVIVRVEITLQANKQNEIRNVQNSQWSAHTEYVCCILDFYVSLRALETKLWTQLLRTDRIDHSLWYI